jgi:predicted Zn-dependent protease
MFIIWGQRHAFKRDKVAVEDTCPHCGKDTTLTSYTAWNVFTLYFVPVIPLGRLRAMLSCPKCKKYIQVKLSDLPGQIATQRGEAMEEVRAGEIDEATSSVVLLVHSGGFAEAEEVIDAIARTGREREAKLLAAAKAQMTGELSGAEQSYRELLVHHPEDAEIHMFLGTLLLSMRRRDEAIDALSRAARLAPDALDVRAELAGALEQAKRWAELAGVLEEMARIEPELQQDKHFAKLLAKARKKGGVAPTNNPYAIQTEAGQP